jgi:hypothetical protein
VIWVNGELILAPDHWRFLQQSLLQCDADRSHAGIQAAETQYPARGGFRGQNELDLFSAHDHPE